MIELDKFKNIHKDSDIYVIGSGPSVNFIDPSFFDNKITIGINQIYKKIKTTYLVRKEYALLQDILKNVKDSIHFISQGNCGGKGNSNYDFIKKNYKDNKNIVVYKHNINNSAVFPDKLPTDGLVVSWSTITTGIHLAAYMGAKNIILLGHDCGTIDNKCNTDSYHTDKTYKIAHKNGETDYKKWLSKIECQTIKLKQKLKEIYKCNVYSLNPFINFGLEGHKYNR